MKKVFLSIVAVAALVAMPMGVRADNPVSTATSTSKVKIITPIAITYVNFLDFGTVAKNTAGAGTVTIVNTNGSQQVPTVSQTAGSLTVITTGTSVPKAATFTITGDGNESYNLTCATTVTLGTGLSVDLTPSIASGSNTLASGGTETLYVGGVLNILATAVSGSYSADFDVSVNYN